MPWPTKGVALIILSVSFCQTSHNGRRALIHKFTHEGLSWRFFRGDSFEGWVFSMCIRTYFCFEWKNGQCKEVGIVICHKSHSKLIKSIYLGWIWRCQIGNEEWVTFEVHVFLHRVLQCDCDRNVAYTFSEFNTDNRIYFQHFRDTMVHHICLHKSFSSDAPLPIVRPTGPERPWYMKIASGRHIV